MSSNQTAPTSAPALPQLPGWRVALGQVGNIALTGARRVASGVDRIPTMPANAAEFAIGRHVQRVQRRAARDVEWAEIEAYRHDPAHPGLSILSDDTLTMDDWDRQAEIARRITPDPVWLPLAHKARNITAHRVVNDVATAVQLAVRGWADRDIISLDGVLCHRLGRQLLHLAERAHGWPCNDEFPEYDDWTAALRHHGTVLAGYGSRGSFNDAAWDAYMAVKKNPDATAEERTKALQDLHEAEEAEARNVTASLTWVAQHHRALWD